MEPFKNFLDLHAAQRLADLISTAHPTFGSAAFVKKATRNLETLELKQRVRQFAHALSETLPPSYPEALEILLRSLPPALSDCEELSLGWHLWPIAQFVETYGLPHPDESVEALIKITQRFTAEFAIRPFIIEDQSGTLNKLLALTSHPNPHVRRWCSEGSRPRLPWGQQIPSLIKDPEPLLPILSALRNDSESYVRRSVANNLNDIAKDHPEFVIGTCRKWLAKSEEPALRALVKHALRTLIKNGDPDALSLVGFYPPDQISLQLLLPIKKISIGESLPFEITLTSSTSRSQKILIDYAIRYPRLRGKTARKVFKGKKLTLRAGETMTVVKRHSLRPTTVRALYPGTHRIEILLNGVSQKSEDFELS